MPALRKIPAFVWAFIAMYIGFALFELSRHKITAYDGFQAAALLALFVYAGRWIKISRLAYFLACLVFLPNSLGQMGLYSSPVFLGRFDWLVHISAAFISCVLFIELLSHNTKLKKREVMAAAFLITIACGAIVEIGEYWGFTFFGFGDGYLGFGSGDNSTHFGPWENSSLDTTFNFIGAGIGLTISHFIGRRNNKLAL